MNIMRSLLILCLLSVGGPSAFAAPSSRLIVVDDLGGDSALPYYRALNLLPDDGAAGNSPAARPPTRPYTDTDMLPVRSERLSPGRETPRVIQAPGLAPMFLIGDDDLSRSWLRTKLSDLLDQQAVGLVVHVEFADALARLRALAPGLKLSPASGDELAERLGIRHYPVLITATGIEP